MYRIRWALVFQPPHNHSCFSGDFGCSRPGASYSARNRRLFFFLLGLLLAFRIPTLHRCFYPSPRVSVLFSLFGVVTLLPSLGGKTDITIGHLTANKIAIGQRIWRCSFSLSVLCGFWLFYKSRFKSSVFICFFDLLLPLFWRTHEKGIPKKRIFLTTILSYRMRCTCSWVSL